MFSIGIEWWNVDYQSDEAFYLYSSLKLMYFIILNMFSPP